MTWEDQLAEQVRLAHAGEVEVTDGVFALETVEAIDAEPDWAGSLRLAGCTNESAFAGAAAGTLLFCGICFDRKGACGVLRRGFRYRPSLPWNCLILAGRRVVPTDRHGTRLHPEIDFASCQAGAAADAAS